MSFEKPSIQVLKQRIVADIELHTGQLASQRGDIYFPLAMAHAGVCYGLHGHIDYAKDQLFDDSADDEHLLKRAEEYGIYQIPAYKAAGTATVAGSNGYTIPAETLYKIGERTWRVTADTTISSGTATLSLRAVEAGSAGNLAVGTSIVILTTLPGVNSQAVIVSMTGGSDVESVDRVRERLRERRQNPPMGGNDADYIAWAKAAHADVTRVWVYRNENGAGTVVLRFVTDNLSTPIPTLTHINAVKDYIDLVRPSGMAGFDVGVLTAKPLNTQFTMISPDTTAVRQSVTAELLDMTRREAIPGGTIKLSKIREAISIASGEDDYTITTTSNVTSNPNELIVPGTITWPA